MKEKWVQNLTFSLILSSIINLVLYYSLNWYFLLNIDSIFRLVINIIICSLFILGVCKASTGLKKNSILVWIVTISIVVLLIIILLEKNFNFQLWNCSIIVNKLIIIGIFIVLETALSFSLLQAADNNKKK